MVDETKEDIEVEEEVKEEIIKEEAKKEDTEVKKEEEIKKAEDNNDWVLEDFLTDTEWKSLLEEEFKQEYFINLNKKLKVDYKKDIVRPPKELVFNAFNSTSISKVIFKFLIKLIVEFLTN